MVTCLRHCCPTVYVDVYRRGTRFPERVEGHRRPNPKERPPVPPPPGRQSHDQRPLQLCIERSRPSRLEG
ncbi:unnamed protein product [Nesidiocoris tenuis]|uniref:Uncharacterized protein n=1 Tax=Nesidiocoris tenuis TaxID=355587 RepID=A0A6H5FYJ1_9HEMI|nr:unnamed protein product [Nesidiocoris tenuis]